MRGLGFRLLALAFGLIAVFTAAELCLRIVLPQETGSVRFAFDPSRGSIPIPNQAGRRTLPGVFDYTYRNNSLGLRGEREYNDSADGLRILMLGDSFTYGSGVDDSKTFSYLVEEGFKALEKPVEVINGGNSSTGTDYALKFFAVIGSSLRPDITALCFFSNDFADNGRSTFYAVDDEGALTPVDLTSLVSARKPWFIDTRLYRWVVSWSHVANLLKKGAVVFLTRSSAKSQHTTTLVVHYRPGWSGYSDSANVRLTEIYLSELSSAVRDAGSELVVFYLPSWPEVQSYRLREELSVDETELARVLARLGYPLVSLTTELAGSTLTLDELYFKEGHWTAQAHSLAATVMVKSLARNLDDRRAGR